MTEFVVENLAASYGKVRVLECVNLQVRSGEIVGLIGGNGAGKSTTLKAVSGTVARASGRVLIDGKEMGPRPEVMARHGVSHVPEGRRLFASLSVEQNIRMGALAAGRRLGGGDIGHLYRIFPACEGLAGRRAGSLSGGEQQMVAILRGLASKPRVLMVDEVNLGLAPIVVDGLVRSLLDAASELSLGVLLVDQNVNMLKKICSRVYVLKNGRSQELTGEEGELESIYFN